MFAPSTDKLLLTREHRPSSYNGKILYRKFFLNSKSYFKEGSWLNSILSNSVAFQFGTWKIKFLYKYQIHFKHDVENVFSVSCEDVNLKDSFRDCKVMFSKLIDRTSLNLARDCFIINSRANCDIIVSKSVFLLRKFRILNTNISRNKNVSLS